MTPTHPPVVQDGGLVCGKSASANAGIPIEKKCINYVAKSRHKLTCAATLQSRSCKPNAKATRPVFPVRKKAGGHGCGRLKSSTTGGVLLRYFYLQLPKVGFATSKERPLRALAIPVCPLAAAPQKTPHIRTIIYSSFYGNTLKPLNASLILNGDTINESGVSELVRGRYCHVARS